MLVVFVSTPCFADGPFFANGIKVGEATQTSAIVWVRLTKEEQAEFGRLKIFTEGLPSNARLKIPMPTNVAPGMPGEVRLSYTAASGAERKTDWIGVDGASDFTHQFKLSNLTPGTQYKVRVEARASSDGAVTATANGEFHTAFATDQRESSAVHRFHLSGDSQHRFRNRRPSRL